MLRPKQTNDFSSIFQYDKQNNTVFLNLSDLHFMSLETVDKFEAAMEEQFSGLGQRVHVVVNYKQVEIAPAVEAKYAMAVQRLQTKHYLSVKRFAATRAFGDVSASAGTMPKLRNHVHASESVII